MEEKIIIDLYCSHTMDFPSGREAMIISIIWSLNINYNFGINNVKKMLKIDFDIMLLIIYGSNQI